VTGNTFVGCSSPQAAALLLNANMNSVVLERNVFAFSLGAAAVQTLVGQQAGDCNVFWSNAAGDYTDYTPGPRDRVADPEFCDMPGGTTRYGTRRRALRRTRWGAARSEPWAWVAA
jgi:hypothetical protein